MKLFSALTALCVTASAGAYGMPVLHQVDNFQGGTTMGWTEGISSPNPPVNLADAGAAGVGDHVLQNVASGGGGAGSKMVMSNSDSRWTGDYLTAGITGVSLFLANSGATPLDIRLGFTDGSTRIGSTTAYTLPADSTWYTTLFDVSPGAMSVISGPGSFTDVMGSVTTFRILDATSGPSWRGDSVAGDLRVDNIQAVPEPSSMALFGLGLTLLLSSRRRKSQSH